MESSPAGKTRNNSGTESYTKEEYQKIKKRTLTEPYVDPKTHKTQNSIGERARGSIELESTPEPYVKGRGARIQSMSVDMGRNNYQNHNQEYDFLQTLTINLNQSLAQGLNSLAMVGAWNMHESRIAKLKNGVNVKNGKNTNNNKNSKNESKKPLLAETNEAGSTDTGKDSDSDSAADGVAMAKKCTYIETCLNTLQYMIGIATLCLPYVVAFGGSIEILIWFVISICTLLSALMVDELCNYYSDINNYSDLVLQVFGIKGQLIGTVVTFFELFLYVVIGIVTGADLLYTFNETNEWMLDNIGDLSLTECILIWGLILLPLMQIIDLKPLAKLSGLGLFGVIATYILLAIVCIEKQVNGTAAVPFDDLFNNFENHFYTQVYKCGYGVGVIISIFCVHTLVPTLKSGMQKPKEFRSIIYLVWLSICPLMLMVTIAGYVAYGEDSDAPITSNFSGAYGPIVLVVLGFKVASLVPSCNLPVTLLLTGLIKQLKCVANVIGQDEDETEIKNKDNYNKEQSEEKSWKAQIVLKLIRFGVPTFLLILALILTICLKSMAFVSSLAGSVCALIMSIIFPCVMYIKYLTQIKKCDSSESMGVVMKYIHIIVAVSVLLIVCSFAGWNLVCLVYYGP